MADIARVGLQVDANQFVQANRQVRGSIDEVTASEKKLQQTMFGRGSAAEQAANASKQASDAYLNAWRQVDHERAKLSRVQAQRDAKEAAQARIEALEHEYQISMGHIKEAAAREFLTPKEAARAGREAAMEYNRQVLSVLESARSQGAFRIVAPGPGGDAMEGQKAYGQLAKNLKNVEESAGHAGLGLGRLNRGMLTVAEQSLGLNAATGHLIDTVGTFAIGTAYMIPVLAGLAALGAAWDHITEKSRKAKEEQDDAIKHLQGLAKERSQAGFGTTPSDVQAVQARRAEIEREIAQEAALAASGSTVLRGQDTPEAAQGRITKLGREYERLGKLVEEGEKSVQEKSLKTYTEENDKVKRAREKAAREREQAIEREASVRAQINAKAEQSLDALNRENEKLQEAKKALDEHAASLQREREESDRMLRARRQSQEAVDQLTVALAGENAVRERRAQAEKDHIPLSEEDAQKTRENAEAIARNEIATRKLNDADKERKKAIDEARKAEEERQRAMEKNIRIAQDSINATIEFARALGKLDDQSARTAESIVELATAAVRLSQGDLTAIPSALHGLFGLFGGGDQAAEKARKDEQAALEKLTRAITDLNNTYRQNPSDIQAQFDQAKANARAEYDAKYTEAKNTLKGDAQYAAIGEANAQYHRDLQAAAEAAAAALDRSLRAFDADIKARELDTQGRTDEAAAVRLQARQAEELYQAQVAGWDAARIEALKHVQALEREADAQQRAAAAAESATRFRNSLLARGAAAIGDTNAAATIQLYEQHRQEMVQARSDNRSPAEIALLQLVQDAEDAALRDQQQIDAINKAAQAQLDALDTQTQAAQQQLQVQQEQLQTQQRTVDAMRQVVDSLREFQDSLKLSEFSPLSPIQQLREARNQFGALKALALGGDVTAAQSLPDASRALLQASRGYNASSAGYVADFNAVQQALAAVQGKFGTQLPVEERILAELQSQTGSLQRQIDAAAAQRATIQAEAQRQIDAINARAAERNAYLQQQIARLQDQINLLQAIRNGIDKPLPGDQFPGDPGIRAATEATVNRLDETNQKLQATVNLLQAGFDELNKRLDRVEAATTSGSASVKTAIDGIKYGGTGVKV